MGENPGPGNGLLRTVIVEDEAMRYFSQPRQRGQVPPDFPFPLAEPEPEPMMITKPCGCTSMVVDGQPVQVSWCDAHDPGYTPPGGGQT